MKHSQIHDFIIDSSPMESGIFFLNLQSEVFVNGPSHCLLHLKTIH